MAKPSPKEEHLSRFHVRARLVTFEVSLTQRKTLDWSKYASLAQNGKFGKNGPFYLSQYNVENVN